MSLRVDLSGNGTGFTQMLNTAKAQAEGFASHVSHEFGSSWAGVGKSLAAGFAGMLTGEGVREAIAMVTGKVRELRELSEQLGTEDVEKIQRWGKAFEKVGGNMSKVATITGQMTEKRNAAMGHDMTSIKSRQELEGFGFSQAEINPSTGLNSLDFMQKAFHFANQSDDHRNQFDNVFGPKATKFAGSEKYFDQAKAPIDEQMYEHLKENVQALNEFKEKLDEATYGLVKFLMAPSIAAEKGQQALEDRRERYGKEHRNMNAVRDKIQAGTATQSEKDWMAREMEGQSKNPNSGIRITNATRKAIQDSPTAPEPPKIYGPPAPGKPMGGDEDVKSQHDQWKKQEQDDTMSLHRAQGGNMTIGDRRALIKQDMGTVDEQIKATQDKLNSKTLGLSKDAYGKMTDIEKDKMRHDLKTELTGEQTKKETLRGELKEKPLDFKADSMSKVGLYSASSVAFNPVLGIQQKQLSVLEKIAASLNPGYGQTASQRDPHSP